MAGAAYERISRDIAELIESGDLAPGGRLPAENELASRYGVTRMTVRQALSSLVDRGLIYRRQGVGTFVADQSRRRRSLNRLTGFTEDMTDELRTVETAIRVKEVITADAEVSGQLGLPPEAEVIYLSRLRTVDGSPSALQDSWIPFGLCPSLARVDLVDDSLYKTLEQSCGVVFAYADQTIRAVAAGPGEAAALEVGTGSPLLKTERITRNDRDTPIELAHSWTRPEFELVTRLER